MKKIPILLLTIIFGTIFSTLFSAKTYALFKDKDGATWWSVEDLLAFSEIADAEEKELCGEDQNCREELYFSRLESEDLEYQALEMLRDGRFWITSVNPTTETLEVLYFDEDQMLKRWGIEEIQPLNFIFLAWFDIINGEIGNYNHELPIEPQFSDDLHLMYADSSVSFNEGYFPADKPFELQINKTNLIDNRLGYIYLAVFGENFNSKGYLDYSDCLEDYREGETCQLMFSPGNGYKYFPPREETIENESNQNDEKIIGLGEVSYIEPVSEETSGEATEQITENNLTPTAPKSPNTGTYTNACEKTIEFPWWLGALIVVGNLTCLWLFFPKKGIDKKRKVR
ncbi:hypothetical protein IJH15_01010 [Candidatus Saccharibacteria bacterium]|nr:hypothetical protein [Candidatus Saccharibacteria bacterium]